MPKNKQKGHANNPVSKRRKRSVDLEEMDRIMQRNGASSNESHDTDEEPSDFSDEEMMPLTDAKSHKHALSRLKETDPEFHEYLQNNDENLLQFSDVDEEDESSEDKKEQFHQLPEKLEVASDDSEASDEEEAPESRLTIGKISKWKKQLQNAPSIPLIRNVVSTFQAAVVEASGTANTEDKKTMKVSGGPVFNAITKMCLSDLQPALHRIMKLPWPPGQRRNIDPKKSKSWLKLKKSIKIYLNNIIKILSVVTDPVACTTILKHIHQMSLFITCIPKFTKLALKAFIKSWSTGEESVRIIAFLCIMTICRNHTEVLDFVLKQMYMCYVRNCKFTSPTTWPLINFMKRSLVEVYALDEVLAYQHAFMYIRQLAINLRNAITIKKKDSIQSVYNWQFIHSILLWTQLLSDLPSREVLKPLIYPLVQTVIGTIKLVPTSKYLPLRYQCIRALTMLSDKTNTFIPIIPFIIEVLDILDLKKQHSNVSFKPMDFSCALKLSKKQLSENGFKDRAIDQVYETMMDYIHTQCYKIGYPELVLPTIVQLKNFLKSCKIANYNKQLKQMMDKIIENATFITEKRKEFSASISDQSAVELWENGMKTTGTPIQKFYINWRKMKDHEVAKSISKQKLSDDHKLPGMPKHKKVLKKKIKSSRQPGELFSDSDSEEAPDLVEVTNLEDD